MNKKLLSGITAACVAVSALTGAAFADENVDIAAAPGTILIAPAPVLPFTDVKAEDRFAEAIGFVYKDGVMVGVSDTEFGPELSLTRAMVVTILHRMAGEPIVNFAMNFADVPAGEYYTEAVRWAQATGVVYGISETEFAPNMNITREQLAAIAYRFAQYCNWDIDEAGKDTNTLSYDDIFDVAEYARPAMHACLASQVIVPRSERIVAPAADATRAEAAQAIFGLCALTPYETPAWVLAGDYMDSVSQRASMHVADNGNGTYIINIEWANSAFETNVWTMSAVREDEGLKYFDETLVRISTDAEGESTEEMIISENGEGYFEIIDGKLCWTGAAEENCRSCVFERMENESSNIPNPLVETDAEGIMNALGLSFKVPEKAENTVYYLINNAIAQMNFKMDGIEFTARIMPSTEFADISGVYTDWKNEKDCKVSGIDAKSMRAETNGRTVEVCLWYDVVPGLMYSLSAEAADLGTMDIAAVAAQTYVPAQGNA